MPYDFVMIYRKLKYKIWRNYFKLRILTSAVNSAFLYLMSPNVTDYIHKSKYELPLYSILIYLYASDKYYQCNMKLK